MFDEAQLGGVARTVQIPSKDGKNKHPKGKRDSSNSNNIPVQYSVDDRE
jgi:hypothetical protein